MKVPGKISFWPFWPFLGQKYIACGDKMVFSEVFGLLHPIYWCCMVKFCYMNIIYCLLMKKWIKILTPKFLTRFGPFFGQKMAVFGQKSTFRPISQNLVIGSSQFRIFKLYFGSIYEITQWKWQEKPCFGRFGPFLVKNTLDVVTKWRLWSFLAYFSQYVDVVRLCNIS